jgi:hypothetical protein
VLVIVWGGFHPYWIEVDSVVNFPNAPLITGEQVYSPANLEMVDSSGAALGYPYWSNSIRDRSTPRPRSVRGRE